MLKSYNYYIYCIEAAFVRFQINSSLSTDYLDFMCLSHFIKK